MTRSKLTRQQRQMAIVDEEAGLANYLAWVRQEYNYIHVVGMTKPMELANIYTDVYVLEDPKPFQYDDLEALNEQHRPRDRYKSKDKSKRLGGVEAVQQNKKLFVLGLPGAGKTTFLRYLAVQAAIGIDGLPQIPVFVPLREWASSGQSLMDFIVGQFELGGFRGAKPFLERQLTDGNVLLLLDGLDEVQSNVSSSTQSTLENQIVQFVQQYYRNSIVLSCRLAASQFVFPKFTTVQMADFNSEQVETFIQSWFGEDGQTSAKMLADLDEPENEPVRELTQTPLLLTLMCIAYRKMGKFPQRRSEIYQEAVEALLTQWDESRGIKRKSQFQYLTLSEKEKMLAAIAHHLFEDGQYLIRWEELNRKVRFYFSSTLDIKIDEREADQIIEEIEAQHGIWMHQAKNIFSFSHLTLQEYFAAWHIVKNKAQEMVERLMAHVGDTTWREVFVLTVGMLDETSVEFCQQYLKASAKLVQADKTIIQLLQWVISRTTSIRNKVNPPAARAFTLYLALAIILERHHSFVRILARKYPDLPHYFFLTLVYARIRVRNLAHDLACSLGFVYTGTLDFIHVDILTFDLAMIYDLSLLKDSPSSVEERIGYLREWSQKLNLSNLYMALMALVVPVNDAPNDDWLAFNQQMETVLLNYWELERFWELTAEQANLLVKYLDANLVLVECLGVVYVPDRAAIENQLLLPPG